MTIYQEPFEVEKARFNRQAKMSKCAKICIGIMIAMAVIGNIIWITSLTK